MVAYQFVPVVLVVYLLRLSRRIKVPNTTLTVVRNLDGACLVEELGSLIQTVTRSQTDQLGSYALTTTRALALGVII